MKDYMSVLAMSMGSVMLLMMVAKSEDMALSIRAAPQPLKLRPATVDDIEGITTIAMAAFPHDPQWPYRYPYRKEHPEDHYLFVRRAFVEYLDRCNAGANEMMVVEVQTENADQRRVIAFSIWDTVSSDNDKATPPVTNYWDRPDGHEMRMRQYANVTMEARQRLFFDRYKQSQRSLRMMATHPDFWGLGAGSLMMEWGIRKATEQGVAITLFASPLGKRLYERFGFVELEKVSVHVEGEKDSVRVSCMAWEPHKLRRPPLADHVSLNRRKQSQTGADKDQSQL